MFNMSLDFDYSYEDYDNTSEAPPVPPCGRESDNNLGAKLSYLYYFMFAFSLLGNGLVLIIIHRFEKLTTVTNILLLNLVFSSLIFMSSLPFMAVYMQLSDWIFGSVMCKLVGSVYYLGFYSSVLFLTLLTFDRHLAVVYSVSTPQVRSRRYAVISCVVVWLVSGLACIRPMILQDSYLHKFDNKTFCDEHPRRNPNIDVEMLRTSGFYLQLFLFLLFPLIVIVYCYVRITITVLSSLIVRRFRTVRLIFIIVLLFFICWTPFNIVLLTERKKSTCQEKQKLGYALQVTRTVAYVYFCISPVFYTFVGKKFQNYFRQMVRERFAPPERNESVSMSTKSNMTTKSTQNDL